MRDKLSLTLLDNDFFAQEHETKHKIAPWFAKEIHKLRESVFTEAMNLHRAFINVAAKPLRHNIGTLMRAMGGGDLGSPEKTALLPDLWASLFLIVPVLSTTFASVERMLRLLPPEAFGWLMIDEAGQAIPQAAAGALMRTKKAVVVGDPIQIQHSAGARKKGHASIGREPRRTEHEDSCLRRAWECHRLLPDAGTGA